MTAFLGLNILLGAILVRSVEEGQTAAWSCVLI
jgi:hypothetical protein